MNAQNRDDPLPHSAGTWDSLPSRRLRERAEGDLRGSLLVDLNGVIRFCSNSVMQLAGCNASDVVGKPVNSFLPGLPIRKETPGYNVAVTTVLLADCGLPLHLSLADGSSKAVQASVTHLTVDGGRMFSVELQWLPPPS